MKLFGWLRRKPRGVVQGRSYTSEAEWVRSEELRPNRLGPGPADIDPKDETNEMPVNDPWRPSSRLGPWPKP